MIPCMCSSQTGETNLWRKQIRKALASGEWGGPGVAWAGVPGNFMGRWECAEGHGVWVTQTFSSVKVEQLRFVHFDVSKFATVPEKDE